MIYRFRMVSDEVDDFLREIEIDADAKFIDLRNAIDKAVGYEPSPMCSFFICDDGWEKGREITLEDMGADSSSDYYLMDETPILDYVEDEGQRLIYVFDYLTDRAFFLELKESRPGEYIDAAKTVKSVGKAPEQHVDLDEFDEKIDAKAAAQAAKGDLDFDFDDDSYGDNLYNDEDIADFGELEQ